MNKSKLENGEVIEEKIREAIGLYYINDEDDTFGKLKRRIETILQDALNQQRRNTIKEVINEIARDKYWLTGEFDYDSFADRLKEFLTKLEK